MISRLTVLGFAPAMALITDAMPAGAPATRAARWSAFAATFGPAATGSIAARPRARAPVLAHVAPRRDRQRPARRLGRTALRLTALVLAGSIRRRRLLGPAADESRHCRLHLVRDAARRESYRACVDGGGLRGRNRLELSTTS